PPPRASASLPYTTLFRSWRSYPGFRPGPVVVCADAGATLRRLADEYVEDVVRGQIARADVVLVTKAGTTDPTLVEQTRAACAAIDRKSTRLNSSHVSISY